MICDGFTHAPGAITAQTMNDMSAMGMAGMDMAGMEAHHAGHSKGGSPEHEHLTVCPFAGAATPMASGKVPLAIAPVPAVARQIALPSLPFVPRRTIVPTRLPRGPPSSLA